MIYNIIAEVVQEVRKVVRVKVEAFSKDEAEVLLAQLFQEYPHETFVEGVQRVVVASEDHLPPKEIRIRKIHEERDVKKDD